MKTQHTPGPWEVHERTTAHLPWAYYIGHPSETVQVSDEEAEANARLMSAAPDLLAASKEVAAWLEMRGVHYRSLESETVAENLGYQAGLLRAAIALAEKGRAS